MKKSTFVLLLLLALASVLAFGHGLTPQQQSAKIQEFASRMNVTIQTNSNVVTVTVALPLADFIVLDNARFNGETDPHYIARAFANGVFFLKRQQEVFQRMAAHHAAIMATNTVSTNAPLINERSN